MSRLLTKIIGFIFFCFGLFLLLTCFDSINIPLMDTILLGVGGLVFSAIGGICLLWHEPYYDTEDK